MHARLVLGEAANGVQELRRQGGEVSLKTPEDRIAEVWVVLIVMAIIGIYVVYRLDSAIVNVMHRVEKLERVEK